MKEEEKEGDARTGTGSNENRVTECTPQQQRTMQRRVIQERPEIEW
jgi:hypothetical protein